MTFDFCVCVHRYRSLQTEDGELKPPLGSNRHAEQAGTGQSLSAIYAGSGPTIPGVTSYTVKVFTGHSRGAGTDANVRLPTPARQSSCVVSS